jgi:hypothetical protein
LHLREFEEVWTLIMTQIVAWTLSD